MASFVSLVSKLGSVGIGFGVTVLIARRFGAAGSGLWALGATFLAITSTVSLCGLDYATTRMIAVYRAAEQWSAVRGWTRTGLVILGAVGSVATITAWVERAPIAALLGAPGDLDRILQTLSLAIVPACLLRLLGGLLRGLRRFAVAEIIEGSIVPASLAVLAFTVGLQGLGQIAEVYVGATFAAATFGLAVWFYILGDRGRPAGPMMFRSALSSSLPMAGTVLALLASPWILTIALARFSGPAEVGIFRVAMQFMLLMGMLLNATDTALSPQMAALHSQNKLKELLFATKNMTLLMIVLGGAPALILVIFAKEFLSILGPEFPRGAPAMQILILGQMVNLMAGPNGSFMIMTGMEKLSFRNALVGLIVVVVASALLIPRYGMVGAATAWACATIYRNLGLTAIIWRLHGLFLPLGIARSQTLPMKAPTSGEPFEVVPVAMRDPEDQAEPPGPTSAA